MGNKVSVERIDCIKGVIFDGMKFIKSKKTSINERYINEYEEYLWELYRILEKKNKKKALNEVRVKVVTSNRIWDAYNFIEKDHFLRINNKILEKLNLKNLKSYKRQEGRIVLSDEFI
jgi:hypothetical protein